MSDFLRSDVMIAFAVMTAVTVASRLGGFWLMGYVTITPRVRRNEFVAVITGMVVAALARAMGFSG